MYFAIQGPTGGGEVFAVKHQTEDVPVFRPAYCQIYDATLFTNYGDAENAIGNLPHKLAKQCRIVRVEVSELAQAAT